ncbi:hypothetical protein EDB82DRAFT_490088 [Fusarium venenatum]|uniref:uncharacterized protein n=1 Tax=Fusarium venenatum TaxID=56646 RepID=UPI001DD7A449|nr:hypothetical protein EDB82DRAFT_490088 [Fusarium venenatum]
MTWKTRRQKPWPWLITIFSISLPSFLLTSLIYRMSWESTILIPKLRLHDMWICRYSGCSTSKTWSRTRNPRSIAKKMNGIN